MASIGALVDAIPDARDIPTLMSEAFAVVTPGGLLILADVFNSSWFRVINDQFREKPRVGT